MKKVIIFDFDGTIADSLQVMLESYNRVATYFRCKQAMPHEIALLRSMHLHDVLKKLHISYFKLPFVLFFTLRAYKKHINEVPLYPGIPEMLRQLQQAGYRLYIVSTNRTDTIAQFLKLRGIDMFAGIYSSGRQVFAKGAVIKKLLQDIGISPAEALYVGDELRDIDAGHQAGIEVLAVSWGYTARSVLQDHADALVDSPAEISIYVTRT